MFVYGRIIAEFFILISRYYTYSIVISLFVNRLRRSFNYRTQINAESQLVT